MIHSWCTEQNFVEKLFSKTFFKICSKYLLDIFSFNLSEFCLYESKTTKWITVHSPLVFHPSPSSVPLFSSFQHSVPSCLILLLSSCSFSDFSLSILATFGERRRIHFFETTLAQKSGPPFIGMGKKVTLEREKLVPYSLPPPIRKSCLLCPPHSPPVRVYGRIKGTFHIRFEKERRQWGTLNWKLVVVTEGEKKKVESIFFFGERVEWGRKKLDLTGSFFTLWTTRTINHLPIVVRASSNTWNISNTLSAVIF